MNSNSISISAPVAHALKKGNAVVALESTIITHGMPYPANRDTATEVEAILREHDVEPATIAVLDGELKIGLSAKEIDLLA